MAGQVGVRWGGKSSWPVTHVGPSIKSDQKISMWHSCKYIPKASKSVIHAGRWLEMTMGGYARRVQQEWEFKIEDFDLTPWWEWWIMTETGVISTWVESTPVKRSTPIPSKRIWKLPRLQSLIKSLSSKLIFGLLGSVFLQYAIKLRKKAQKSPTRRYQHVSKNSCDRITVESIWIQHKRHTKTQKPAQW